jgi:hypothetical protein
VLHIALSLLGDLAEMVSVIMRKGARHSMLAETSKPRRVQAIELLRLLAAYGIVAFILARHITIWPIPANHLSPVVANARPAVQLGAGQINRDARSQPARPMGVLDGRFIVL